MKQEKAWNEWFWKSFIFFYSFITTYFDVLPYQKYKATYRVFWWQGGSPSCFILAQIEKLCVADVYCLTSNPIYAWMHGKAVVPRWGPIFHCYRLLVIPLLKIRDRQNSRGSPDQYSIKPVAYWLYLHMLSQLTCLNAW